LVLEFFVYLMDLIRITEIRAYGYTGYLPEEQVLGQWFEVDISLWLDLATPGKSDKIEDTVDYRSVINLVKELIKTSKLALLESLATVIANSILEFSPIVKQVNVALTKPAAPIPDFGGKITIDITRSK
jgi:7,8-dihydroneopterin aldolase/epimerase/oxygenase